MLSGFGVKGSQGLGLHKPFDLGFQGLGLSRLCCRAEGRGLSAFGALHSSLVLGLRVASFQCLGLGGFSFVGSKTLAQRAVGTLGFEVPLRGFR